MKLSKSSLRLIHAVKAGYSVSDSGQLLKNGKPSKQKSLMNGYPVLTFRLIEGGVNRSVKVLVHRIQAYQSFGNQMFADGICCRHLNSNKLDNSKANIAIGTAKENSMDKPPEDRLRFAINAASKLRRFTDSQVASIRQDHENGVSYRKLAIKYNVGKGTLSYIFNEARYNGLVPKPAKQKPTG